MAKNNNRNVRRQAMIRIVIIAAILLCVNVLASWMHRGLDLTTEKRFTLSEPTVKLLHNMHEVAVIDIYLKGKFPADLQRLQEAVRERLNAFKNIAGNRIVFRFTDPLEGKNEKEKEQAVRDMQQKGMLPLELNQSNDEEYSMKMFFPYALVQYNGRELPIMLLEDKTTANSSAERINYSESLLEYKFAHALNIMAQPDVARIAYLVGNGEPLDVHAFDMLRTLGRAYQLDTIDLSRVAQLPARLYDAVLLVQPTTPLTGPEKLRIDQYIMNGGHMLIAYNSLKASLDSLKEQPQFMALPYELDIDDLLFKYGVRVNNDLVEDEMNLPLPRMVNDGPAQAHDWIYFPRINPMSEHPIVRNMDFLRGYFTNSIDTIRTAGIKKTILLTTSKNSQKAGSPVLVRLSMMNYKPADNMFTKSYLPVAVLLEGKFHSAFVGKLAPEFIHYLADSLKMPYKQACDSPTSIIVTSIGDAFINDYSPTDGVRGMGYYWPTKEYFANRSFLLNSVEYLTDKSGILEARSKESKLRLLDVTRAKDEKTKWQAVNIIIPIAVVLIFASAYFFFRKRRYETRSVN